MYKFYTKKAVLIFVISFLILLPEVMADKAPSLKKLRNTNLSLYMEGFVFGSGITLDNSNNYTGDGFEMFQSAWCGSGFIVKEDGTFVTNYHVARRALRGSGKFDDGSSFTISHIKVYDPEKDLAIMKLTGFKKFGTVEIGNSNEPDVMDPVYAAGNGLCENLAITEGTINQVIKNDQGKRTLFRHSATIAPGNSGGPLYEGDKVIGVNVMTKPPYDFHYAIAINEVKNLLSPQFDKNIQLQSAFPTDYTTMFNKAKQVYAKNGQVPGKVGDEWGQWCISVNLFDLMDALISLQGEQNSDLSITVHNARNQIIGFGALPGSEMDGVIISTDFAQTVYITVWNSSPNPVNFGLTVMEIVW